MNLGFQAVVFHQGAGDSNPFIASFVHGANLDLGICSNLLGNVLGLAGLNVQLAFEDFCGTERTNLGLITIDGCQEIGTSILKKLYYFFHFRLQARATRLEVIVNFDYTNIYIL